MQRYARLYFLGLLWRIWLLSVNFYLKRKSFSVILVLSIYPKVSTALLLLLVLNTKRALPTPAVDP